MPGRASHTASHHGNPSQGDGTPRRCAASSIRSASDVIRVPRTHPCWIHVLHLGKHAGTQMGELATQIHQAERTTRTLRRDHVPNLGDLPATARYVFRIRDPIARCVRTFSTRKRKGQPRYDAAWSEHDAFAFHHFDHANDLAETPFEPSRDGHGATTAMKSLTHTSMHRVDGFTRTGAFPYVRPPLWMLRTERFDDLHAFLHRARLGHLAETLEIPRDAARRHANDDATIPPLSGRAERNLRVWSAQDLAFYAMGDAWLDEPSSEPPAPTPESSR